MFAVAMDAITMDKRPRPVLAGTGAVATSPESAMASDLFDQFVSAGTFKAVLSTYRQMCELLRIKPTNSSNFYPKLKAKLRSWKAASLWAKVDKRANHKCYNRGKACPNTRVLIIGAGPCGLRTAIEVQLLGAKVVVVEKRDRFSRNNVLHLWPFVIHDLRNLGAKKFFGKFCAGSIDHISIRQLQLILLKVALLLGVEVHENVAFTGLNYPPEDQQHERIGWRAQVLPVDHPVAQYEFDIIVGADGKRNTLMGFNRKEFRGKLAIAITANFINRHTLEEARVLEISGVAFIFNQKFFQDMKEQMGIDLENIVYYKDDTHYFVMTAKKQSLLERGVILKDYSDTARLLAPENVDRAALMEYARDATDFATNFQLPHLDFAVNHYGQADIAMFDFTSMYAAENASRVLERRGHKLLQALVGDSLLEPFWPTGSGCARGFLSSLDAAWMVRSWASGKLTTLQVLSERESIYRLLAQTTPENLNKDFNQYTLNPTSRYPNLNAHSLLPGQVRSLYDTDAEIIEEVPDLVIDMPKKRRRRESIIHPDALLSWCQRQVALYDNIKIENLTTSWKNGLALCAIIHRYRPDLVDMSSLSPSNVARNNQLAFDICEKDFGIPPVMTGQEMAECEVPDKLSMFSYVTQIYETFRGEIPHMPRPAKQQTKDDQPTPLTPSSQQHGLPLSILNRISQRLQNKRRYSLERDANKDEKKTESQKRSRISTAIIARRRMREKDKGVALDLDTEDVSLTSYKKITSHLDKESFNSRVRLLEEQMMKDAGVNVRVSENVGTTTKKPALIGRLGLDDWSMKILEKQILNQSSEPIKKDKVRVSRFTKDEWNVKLLEERMKHQLQSPPKETKPEKLKVMQEIFESKQNSASKSQPTAPLGSEVCYFCQKRVYLMERLSAEGLFFHRSCFKCEYCGASLRLGNYSFDRTGACGGKFYCRPHFRMQKPDRRWQELMRRKHAFLAGEVVSPKVPPLKDLPSPITPVPVSSTNPADVTDAHPLGITVTLSSEKAAVDGRPSIGEPSDIVRVSTVRLAQPAAGDALRDRTPERVEYENAVELSEEELLNSELDEEELTQKNLGSSHEIATSEDEYSDLSTDTESEEEAFAEEFERSLTADETRQLAESWQRRYSKERQLQNKREESSCDDDESTEAASETETEGDEDTSGDIDSGEEYSPEDNKPKKNDGFAGDELVVHVPVMERHKQNRSSDEETSGSLTDTETSDGSADLDATDTEESDSEPEPKPAWHEIPTIVIEESPPQENVDQEWGEKEAEAAMRDATFAIDGSSLEEPDVPLELSKPSPVGGNREIEASSCGWPLHSEPGGSRVPVKTDNLAVDDESNPMPSSQESSAKTSPEDMVLVFSDQEVQPLVYHSSTSDSEEEHAITRRSQSGKISIKSNSPTHRALRLEKQSMTLPLLNMIYGQADRCMVSGSLPVVSRMASTMVEQALSAAFVMVNSLQGQVPPICANVVESPKPASPSNSFHSLPSPITFENSKDLGSLCTVDTTRDTEPSKNGEMNSSHPEASGFNAIISHTTSPIDNEISGYHYEDSILENTCPVQSPDLKNGDLVSVSRDISCDSSAVDGAVNLTGVDEMPASPPTSGSSGDSFDLISPFVTIRDKRKKPYSGLNAYSWSSDNSISVPLPLNDSSEEWNFGASVLEPSRETPAKQTEVVELSNRTKVFESSGGHSSPQSAFGSSGISSKASANADVNFIKPSVSSTPVKNDHVMLRSDLASHRLQIHTTPSEVLFQNLGFISQLNQATVVGGEQDTTMSEEGQLQQTAETTKTVESKELGKHSQLPSFRHADKSELGTYKNFTEFSRPTGLTKEMGNLSKSCPSFKEAIQNSVPTAAVSEISPKATCPVSVVPAKQIDSLVYSRVFNMSPSLQICPVNQLETSTSEKEARVNGTLFTKDEHQSSSDQIRAAASSSPVASREGRFSGYSGSFAEKMRSRNQSGNSIYFKSLDINLHKVDFPLLSQSTSTQGKEPLAGTKEVRWKDDDTCFGQYPQPDELVSGVAGKRPADSVLQDRNRRSSVEATVPPSILVHRTGRTGDAEVIYREDRKAWQDTMLRRSIHEDIEGVPFADDEKRSLAEEDLDEVFEVFPASPASSGGTSSQLNRSASSLQGELSHSPRNQPDFGRITPSNKDSRAIQSESEEETIFGGIFGRRHQTCNRNDSQYEELSFESLFDNEEGNLEDEAMRDILEGNYQTKRVEIVEPPPEMLYRNSWQVPCDESPQSTEEPCGDNYLSVASPTSGESSQTTGTTPSSKLTPTTDSSKTDGANYLESSISVEDIDVGLSPTLSTTPRALSSSSDPSPDTLASGSTSFKARLKIRNKNTSKLDGTEDKQKSNGKKSLLSLLGFGKNGSSKGKDRNKDVGKERSSSLPADLSARTPPKERSFPRLKLPRSRERGRDKQKKKYEVSGKTTLEKPSSSSCEFILEAEEIVRTREDIPSFHDMAKSPLHFLSELRSSKPFSPILTNVVAPENGIAPKASEDSFTDTEEDNLRGEKQPQADPAMSIIIPPDHERNLSDKERKTQRVVQRVLRQQELKRLRTAQEIQRRLEEVEVQQRELEQRGVEVEKALRNENDRERSQSGETDLMQEWFHLVHSKNKFIREEQELLIRAKDLELEGHHYRLQQEMRERMAKDDSLKSTAEIEEEGRILAEMLEIVEKRDDLVAMLDQLKIREEKEDRDLESKMQARGLQLSPVGKS